MINPYLQKELEKYPKATLQDQIKFIYQATLGCEHAIKNNELAYKKLVEECKQLENTTYHIEPISDRFVRFYLFKANEIELKTIQHLFIKTSEVPTSKEDLIQELKQLPTSKELEDYIQAGCPALSHSKIYHDNYQPHYRILKKEYAYYFDIFVEINRRLENKEELLVAIDGMCGSGKSTLGAILHEVYDSHLFHMDDFYLQTFQRTKQRYQTPGENVDHERFLKEVLKPLSQKQTIFYQKFSCDTMDLETNVTSYPYKKINIIEGTYSLHPDLRNFYDFKIGLRIDPDYQLERILHRNGPVVLEQFKEKWIPLENLYFNSFHIFNIVDYLFQVKK